MDIKELLGLLSTFIGIVSYGAYFAGMARGHVKPHIFSWFIWGIIMEIIYIIQWQQGSGPGAWVTLVSSVFCILICLIGWKNSEKHITRSDWFVLVLCQVAIPFWYVVDKPIFTMVLLTLIELAAFFPTIRKSWNLPWEEPVLSYSITGSKFVVSLFAIQNFTAVNWLYPATLFVMNALLVGILLARRSVVTKPHTL